MNRVHRAIEMIQTVKLIDVYWYTPDVVTIYPQFGQIDKIDLPQPQAENVRLISIQFNELFDCDK